MGTVNHEEVKAVALRAVTEHYDEMAKEVVRRVPLDYVEKVVRDVWRKFIYSLTDGDGRLTAAKS